MANEITLTAKLSASKNGTSVSNLTSTKSVDMTGAEMILNVQTLNATPSTYDDLVLGSIAAAGDRWILLRNPNTTAIVTVAVGGTTDHFILSPGQLFGPVKLKASVTIKAKADVASASLEVCACEV
jgi:hypothetical protein